MNFKQLGRTANLFDKNNLEGANGQYADNIMLNEGSTALPYQPYEVWHDLTQHIMSTTWTDGSTYSRSSGSWSSSLTKKRSRKKK